MRFRSEEILHCGTIRRTWNDFNEVLHSGVALGGSNLRPRPLETGGITPADGMIRPPGRDPPLNELSDDLLLVLVAELEVSTAQR